MFHTNTIAALRARLGDRKVLADIPTQAAYAVDASIYRIVPQAVVLVEDESDLCTAIDFSRSRRTPLTARSGGTNLTGNALGDGIILEFSRLDRILEVNRIERWVRVQPGMVLAELNRRLAASGLMFGPDPSSGEMCKIGGMLGNNSAGPHTLKYGAMKDNVVSMRARLPSGRALEARRYLIGSRDFDRLLEDHPEVEAVYKLVQRHHGTILARRRRVSKNSSGYNLFDLADGLSQGWFDLHRLLIGSEGTLALATEATLRLLPRPARTVTALVFLLDINQIGAAVNALLPLKPSAMELLDSSSLDLIGRDRFSIPANARAMLLIELDEEPVDERLAGLKTAVAPFSLCGPVRAAVDAAEQEAFWAIRKAIYPTLYRFDAKRKPINFADDVVVPAARLPELLKYLDGLFAREGVRAAVYGHVGDGNAHVNPLMDLTDPAEVERMIRMSHEIHETVIDQFGGSLCGEHGDGRVRAEFLPQLYGEEIYQLFLDVKRSFDPDNLFNPGVKLSRVPFTTHIDAERLAKGCATCGKCNAVCPVYDVVKEETNSARGWFHILTDKNFRYEDAGRAVEACLNCKSCRVVCPAGIDVSAVVLDRRAERPNRLTGTIFRLQRDHPMVFETLLRSAASTQWLWDRPYPRKVLEWASQPLLRRLAPSACLPAAMLLPRLATRSLRERHRGLTEEAGHTGSLAYFHGCAANYFADGVGDAVIRLLKRQGVDPVLPRQHCSGTPIETYGHRSIVADHARFNLASLNRFDTVVTGCASCTFMLKDYERFATTDHDKRAARQLAGRVRHITEYLVKDRPLQGIPTAPPPAQRPTVVYHSSCHLRAAGVIEEPKALLRQVPGIRFTEMRDAERGAGGAGTFILKNYNQSQEIFQRKRDAIATAGADVVATSCPACMIQLQNGLRGAVSVRHVAQILDEMYRPL